MPLPKLSPEDLAEALDDLAKSGYAETFPNVPEVETIEADAAAFVRAATAFLREVVEEGGEMSSRAIAILGRLE